MVTQDGHAPSLQQRTLFDGTLLQIGYIEVRPVSSACGDIETSARNVLALPLGGVFAKHDGPRAQAIATPNHALFISAGRPYRLSFPGAIGDQCLALRFSSDALSRVLPEAMAGDGFDAARFAQHLVLPPELMLARSRLWWRLRADAIEPLEAEELGLALLRATWRAAEFVPAASPRRLRAGTAPRWQLAGSALRRGARHVQRTIEAVATAPERSWTLGELAAHACVSPGHLAHVFRAETGLSVYGYVVRARLARSLDAVLDSAAGLTEIALDAGFASHSHFTAKFRALFGHTPLELRRSLRATHARQLRTIATAPELMPA